VPREVPVGAGEIVAVKATAWPAEAGFGAAVRAVEVAVVVVPLTVSVTEEDVEVAKPVLPE
jgi:hypothetical protein